MRLAAIPPVHAPLWRPRDLIERDRTLVLAAAVCLVPVAPTLIATAADDRTIYGVSVWAKPLKFQLSAGLFLLTLAWFAPWLGEAARRGRVMRAVAWTAAFTALFEVVWITARGALGMSSHFAEDPLGAFMFPIMGLAATVLTLTAAALALLVALQGRRDVAPALRRSGVAGLAISGLLGVVTGFAIAGKGGHWVGGAPTDAAGLTLFGWSREAGDLRVAHVFALHAMQALPLVGWALLALRAPAARLWITATGVSVAALVAATLFQALAGEPFLPSLVF